MISVSSILLTLVLFSELSSHLVAVATKIEDGILGSFIGDEPMTESVVVPPSYRRRLVLDNMRAEDGNPKIIVSDMRPRGHGTFPQGLPLLRDPSLSHTPAEYSLEIDRRDADLDVLRCMIGRVYRPCWKV